eukprot:2362721-Prymnesium_polylepis.1
MQASGLEWERILGERPAEGMELENAQLATALADGKIEFGKIEFTKAEWSSFGVTDLCQSDFIESDGSYFKPKVHSKITRVGWKPTDVDWEKPEDARPYHEVWIAAVNAARAPDRLQRSTVSAREGFRRKASPRRGESVPASPRAADAEAADGSGRAHVTWQRSVTEKQLALEQKPPAEPAPQGRLQRGASTDCVSPRGSVFQLAHQFDTRVTEGLQSYGGSQEGVAGVGAKTSFTPAKKLATSDVERSGTEASPSSDSKTHDEQFL